MNYIGSKRKLLPFLLQSITNAVSEPLCNLVFCDLFSGTGVVANSFKPMVKSVIANDFEYYSYVLIRNSIGNNQLIKDAQQLIKTLNHLPPKESFIFTHYCSGGKAQRNYFTNQNGKKIDAIRSQIETWFTNQSISEDEYFFLLASLLESADKVANTASVYGAYLKHIKASAAKPLHLQAANFTPTDTSHRVFHQDANELIRSISGDILYLDPPYNQRQYGANYHLLNTIAQYNVFQPKGKTGLPNYQKSVFCKSTEVYQAFEQLISNAKFKHIFISYNNEGLLSVEDIQSILRQYGHYQLFTKENYQRFKADTDKNRSHKASSTHEYLHYLHKN